MGFETFTKGMQDANEVLNRNFAAVETQLSNKAEKYTKMLEGNGMPQTVQEILALEPGIYSWVQEVALDGQPEDTPSSLMRVEFRIHRANGTGTRTYELAYTDGATNSRRYFGESGPEYTIRWAQMARASAPQRFDLTLHNGLLGRAKYSKDQFGMVWLDFNIYKSETEDHISHNILVSYLPEGFRPKDNTLIPVWVGKGEGDNTKMMGNLILYPSGEIWFYVGYGIEVRSFAAQCGFYI